MFKNLTDFSYKRSTKEAVGFYLAYLFLIVILGALLGGIIGLLIGQEGIDVGTRFGSILAILTCLGISFAILSKKNLLKNFGLILVALLSGILAFAGGGILGLIPVAYLSSR